MTVEPSSGNVFADLGMDDPEGELQRAKEARRKRRYGEPLTLTQDERKARIIDASEHLLLRMQSDFGFYLDRKPTTFEMRSREIIRDILRYFKEKDG